MDVRCSVLWKRAEKMSQNQSNYITWGLCIRTN